MTTSRAFLNLWFGKPMVCMRVAFHENNTNHENNENDEDNSDSCNKELSAGLTEITEATEMTKPWKSKVQTTGSQTAGLEIPEQGGQSTCSDFSDSPVFFQCALLVFGKFLRFAPICFPSADPFCKSLNIFEKPQTSRERIIIDLQNVTESRAPHSLASGVSHWIALQPASRAAMQHSV